MPHKVVILGSGPAGLTAAIYSARAGLEPLVIGGFEAGGQLMLTTSVENFPGFPDGVQGPELMDKIRTQAKNFGTEFIDRNATAIDFSSKPFKITVKDKDYEADTVIIATGSSAKWLGLPSEKKFRGHGVTSCAVCDGFFFKEKDVLVVGGGDTAMEDALFLTKFAKTVSVVHRRDKLRASKIMQEKAFKNDKIKLIWNSVLEEITGDSKVDGVRLKNVQTNEITEMKCDGVFIAIGHHPNTEIFKGKIELDDKGYVVARDRTRTSVEGVFVAGDIQDFNYRQAITAAAGGCMAAIDAERYLESLE
jgi:thioredoxin reductase (NADPH)